MMTYNIISMNYAIGKAKLIVYKIFSINHAMGNAKLIAYKNISTKYAICGIQHYKHQLCYWQCDAIAPLA